MKNKSFLLTIAIVIIAMSSVAQVKGTFTDTRDGKVYKTIKISTQTWMAENLAYKANSGCWAYNNNASNVTKYGYLYDWKTAKTVCPTGWHVPTDAEWTTLTTYLDGDGGKLKEIGTTHWISPNEEATNETGFTALPGGARDYDGTFFYIGNNGGWWSATENYTSNAWSRYMYYSYSNVISYYTSSVRRWGFLFVALGIFN